MVEASEIPDGEIRNRAVRTRNDRHTLTVASKSDLEALSDVWRDHENADGLEEHLETGWETPENRSYVEISDDLVALPVRSVEGVEPSGEYVYDFSVEDDENFIAGTGGTVPTTPTPTSTAPTSGRCS